MTVKGASAPTGVNRAATGTPAAGAPPYSWTTRASTTPGRPTASSVAATAVPASPLAGTGKATVVCRKEPGIRSSPTAISRDGGPPARLARTSSTVAGAATARRTRPSGWVTVRRVTGPSSCTTQSTSTAAPPTGAPSGSCTTTTTTVAVSSAGPGAAQPPRSRRAARPIPMERRDRRRDIARTPGRDNAGAWPAEDGGKLSLTDHLGPRRRSVVWRPQTGSATATAGTCPRRRPRRPSPPRPAGPRSPVGAGASAGPHKRPRPGSPAAADRPARRAGRRRRCGR